MDQMKKNRFVAILSTCMYFLCMMILLFLSSSGIPKDYNIYFYEDDKIISHINLDVGETLKEKDLKKIESLIENEDNYHLAWSYKKDIYEPVDFSKIYYDTFVYLFRLENEFEIFIEDSEHYEYKVITDGPITNGSNARVHIEHNVDLNTHHPTVRANGHIVHPDIDGYYVFENINQDILIEVEYLEIITINPIIKDYVYDGLVKEIEYELIDSNKNKLENKDVEISIYDKDNNLINEIKNAGTYKVVYNYIGTEYYAEDVEVNIYVSKAVPAVNVSNIKLNYTGGTLGFKEEDVITSSDGLISFENNSHVEIGRYEVVIKIAETNNYEAVKITKELEIIKGIPTIIKTPTPSYGHENYKLKDVELKDGLANIVGKFTWKEPNTVLTNNMKEFTYIFTPSDLDHYEIIEGSIEVEVLTPYEALEILSTERERLYEELLPIFEDTITELPKLPTNTSSKVNINWISTHTALSIDENGVATIIGNDGTYEVILLAYLQFGDTVDYLQYSFNLKINNAKELNETNVKLAKKAQEESISTELEEEVVETAEIDVSVLDSSIYQNDECNSEEVEEKDNIKTITTKQKQRYDYQANVNRHRQISEVILWKVISDGASDGNNNIKFLNLRFKNYPIKKQLIINKNINSNMKGDNI